MLVKGEAPKMLIAAKVGTDCRQSRGEAGCKTTTLQEPHDPAGGKPAPIFSGHKVVAAIPSRPEGRGFSRRN
jgi:hypothetical protein